VLSIDAARRDVQNAVDEALNLVDSSETRTATRVEAELWTALLSLGRALMVLFLARQMARPRAQEYEHAGARWQIAGERTSEFGTRFGKVVFVRPVGRQVGNPRAACDLPIDRELGLCGGFSFGVVLATARLCAQMAFAPARENFRETYEWAPSPRAVLRMVDSVGTEARAFLEQVPAPLDDGDVLVIQADGKGAPMISPEEYRRRGQPHAKQASGSGRKARKARRSRWPKKPRRTKGKKSKNAKVAIVGVIYTLRQTPEGTDGPINKRLVATFESHEALFIWLRREADKRGYGTKRTLFLGDGSEHLWRLQKQYFPEAEVCIDWCHIVEKLWGAGECLFEEGSDELKEWMGKQATRLRRGATQAIIDELKQKLSTTPKTGPGNKGKRLRLEKAIKYLTDHKARMRYAELRRDDLDIGTGAVEGAVRNLVGMRLDGPGMRWSRQRSERILHLRCILLNGQWAEFAAYLERRPHLRLAARPEPATPHLAKAA
jgi:hypothetical protein